MAREQDNVGDRDLELFQSDAECTNGCAPGERPTSNPRYVGTADWAALEGLAGYLHRR